MTSNDKQYEIVFWEINPEEKGKRRIVRVPTTKEAFDDYYRPINAYRKTEQRHGRCVCPADCRLLCNMDCGNCLYKVAGDTDSLNETIEDGDGNTTERIETIAADTDIEAEYAYAELIRRLREKLNDLTPEYREICRLIMDGKNEREMAAELNTSKTTLHRHKEDALNILREALEKYFF